MIPKLSACVPTYNRREYLAQSLPTLLSQSFADFELLVVDNCSTDGTEALVASFSDPRIRYHRNERNLGSRGNWNRCLDLARGELVAICHDDDLYEREFLERTVAALDAHPRASFVHTAALSIDRAGRMLRTIQVHPRDAVFESRQVFMRYLQENHDVVMSTVVGRKSAYDSVERFTLDFLCADFEMWLKLALQGDVAYIAQPLVRYRTHDENTTLTMSPARFFEENEAIVRRAVGWAEGLIPGIREREEELVERNRRIWARRILVEALYLASFGKRAAAREHLRVARSLAEGHPREWLWRLAGLSLNPLGAGVLRGIRIARKKRRELARDSGLPGGENP